jgi:hypothetical protein
MHPLRVAQLVLDLTALRQYRQIRLEPIVPTEICRDSQVENRNQMFLMQHILSWEREKVEKAIIPMLANSMKMESL